MATPLHKPASPLARLRSLPLTGWFPGHMLRAGRDMQEKLQLIDVVVELLDARLPNTSRNPALEDLLWTKPRLLVFNKTDLADPDATRAWQEWFRQEGIPAAFIDAQRARGVQDIVPLVRTIWAQERERRGATRPLVRPLRLMIVGIPNIGKSTLVNRLATKHAAAVGPKPGVTRSQQWVRLQGDVELLDTPGVAWPRVEDKLAELKLGLAGTIKDEVIGEELLAEFLWAWIFAHDCAPPWQAYGLTQTPPDPELLMEAIAHRRGLLRGGGAPDLHQAAIALLTDYRAARLGRYTFDSLG